MAFFLRGLGREAPCRQSLQRPSAVEGWPKGPDLASLLAQGRANSEPRNLAPAAPKKRAAGGPKKTVSY
ncbi:hypothetical protein SGRA_1573 [Saprospira grandis str. Lewin]|uniref:Uncharacterized protein n=1 Tax=Saprospira grandis (strain Lewin) TaxID=984262 RepID=H6L9U5_SAPGL|nr:hypothetical protein SGRA_1573 [Saprospira grandis str. Lewin]